MSCPKITIKNSSYCIGDLNHRIQFNNRSLEPRFDNYTDPLNDFTNSTIVYAAIETINPIEYFDNSNIRIGVSTSKFITRYSSDLINKNTILYNSKYFKILRVNNLNQNNLWLEFYCEEKGVTTNKVNQA